MTRLPDWQSRLSAYIAASANQPFKYGSFDCGLFAAGAVEALTGVYPATELRGAYDSWQGAFSSIRSICGTATVEAIAERITAKYDMANVAPLTAQRGDLILINRGRRSSLGIVAMQGFEIITPSRNGLVRYPMSLGTRAWHVG